MAWTQQSSAVIFHDPLSSTDSGDLTRQSVPGATKTVTRERKQRNAPKGKPRTRAEAIEAVIQELRRISQERTEGNHGGAGAGPSCP